MTFVLNKHMMIALASFLSFSLASHFVSRSLLARFSLVSRSLLARFSLNLFLASRFTFLQSRVRRSCPFLTFAHLKSKDYFLL